MPDRLIPILGSIAGALALTYLAFIVATISFATWQTQSISQIRETEERIADLEEEYYDAIAVINETDPSVHGLHAPIAVRYVTAVKGTSVTFAR